MNANDVLIDLLEDNRRRLQRVFGLMSDDCLVWKPEADANSIAITVWHMARMMDVFLTQQARGDLPEEECWFQQGWAGQTGYDPRGTGQNGWGMLTGYTQDEVAAIPASHPGTSAGISGPGLRCGQGVPGRHAHRRAADPGGRFRWEIYEIPMHPDGLDGQCQASW